MVSIRSYNVLLPLVSSQGRALCFVSSSTALSSCASSSPTRSCSSSLTTTWSRKSTSRRVFVDFGLDLLQRVTQTYSQKRCVHSRGIISTLMYFIPPSSLLGFYASWRSSVRFQKQQMQLSQQLCMKTTWASPPASSSQKGGRNWPRPTDALCLHCKYFLRDYWLVNTQMAPNMCM